MTISLSLIKKQQFNISTFIQKYTSALECLYTCSELENYVYSKSGGVLGITFEGKLPSTQEDKLLIENTTIASRNICTVKIWHENTHESRMETLEKFKEIANVNSTFAFLNQNIRYLTTSPLHSRYPIITKNNNVYDSVGQMTSYFLEGPEHTKDYGEDNRGIEYAKTAQSNNIIDTINSYYENYLDSNRLPEFIDPQKNGLKHFTSVLHAQDNELKATFLQNKQPNFNFARYFFEPDTIFCSNENILRVFRGMEYPNQDIVLKKNLASYTCNL